MTATGSGQLADRKVGREKKIEQRAETGRVRERVGLGTEKLDELSFERGGVVTNTLQGGDDPYRSLTREPISRNVVRNKDEPLSGWIQVNHQTQGNAFRIASGRRAGKTVLKCLRNRPDGEVRVPMRTEFSPC